MITGRQLLAVVTGIFVFLAAGFFLVWLWGRYLAFPVPLFAQALIALGLPAGATLASVAVFGMRLSGVRWTDMGFRPARFSFVLSAIGIWLLCLPVVTGLIFLMSRLTGSTAIGRQMELIPALGTLTPWQLPLFALLIVVVAPLSEEILFRGLLFGWMRRHASFWPSALASALLFSLMHMILEVIPPTIVLGLIFAWMYERSRSLWPSVVVHMLHNGIVFAVTAIAIERGIPLGG